MSERNPDPRSSDDTETGDPIRSRAADATNDIRYLTAITDIYQSNQNDAIQVSNPNRSELNVTIATANSSNDNERYPDAADPDATTPPTNARYLMRGAAPDRPNTTSIDLRQRSDNLNLSDLQRSESQHNDDI